MNISPQSSTIYTPLTIGRSVSDLDRALELGEFSFQRTSISVFWIAKDASIYRANRAAGELLGYSQQELQLLRVFDIDPSTSPQTWPQHWQKLKHQQSMTFTSRHLTKDGQLLPVEIHVNFLQLGDEEFNIAFAQNMTTQRKTEAALRESQERYACVIKATNDGIWDWDLDTDEIYFSERWQSMLGFSAGEFGNTPTAWLSRIHPEDIEPFLAKLERYRTGKLAQFSHEYRICHKDGHYLWVLCRGMALNDFNNRIYRIAGSLTDITARRKAQEQLIYDAHHDPLTGLPNRTLLLERLDEAIHLNQRHSGANFAVLFLDLDRFKTINDSLGHRAGDRLLIEVARRLQQCTRSEDTVARLGGDEFVILLLGIDSEDDAYQAVKHIHQTLTTPLELNEQPIYPAASIGISLSNKNKSRAEDYLRQADIAMYEAKSSRKPNFVLFNKNMHARVMNRLQLEIDLRQAIKRNELQLHYQPIVSLSTGTILGFEALLRWMHAGKTPIGPNVFIPIAEETGEIIPIGKWVLQQACRQMHLWRNLHHSSAHLFITVNLSTQQLAQADFVQHTLSVLERENLQPESLKLEITESSIIENTDVARERLSALKESNITICMDDFGTGYSSLSYLHQLPIDCLKIDRSFVSQLQDKPEKSDIIRAILAIAHSLNLEVVAEGIETRMQVELLKAISCTQGQGYFFNKPLPADEATHLLLQT